jgi:hypothetical protein
VAWPARRCPAVPRGFLGPASLAHPGQLGAGGVEVAFGAFGALALLVAGFGEDPGTVTEESVGDSIP